MGNAEGEGDEARMRDDKQGSWWDFEFYFQLRFISSRNTTSEVSGTCTNSQLEMRRSKCSELHFVTLEIERHAFSNT